MADFAPAKTAIDKYADQRTAETVGPLSAAWDAERAALAAQVEKLQAEIDALQPPTMRFGASNNMPGGTAGENTLSNFLTYEAKLGPWTNRRSFPTAASLVRSVESDYAEGVRSTVSLKRGMADLATWRAIAPDLPPKTVLLPNHEFEKDFARGAEFVTWYRGVHDAVMGANPALEVGTAHLIFAWRDPAGVGKAGINTGTLEPASAWDVGDQYRHFNGCDVYAREVVPLASYVRFQNWLQYFLKNSKKPIRLCEYGQGAVPIGGRDPAIEARRAEVVPQDIAYLKSLKLTDGSDAVEEVDFWHGTGDAGLWAPMDPATQQVWRDAAASGATP